MKSFDIFNAMFNVVSNFSKNNLAEYLITLQRVGEGLYLLTWDNAGESGIKVIDGDFLSKELREEVNRSEHGLWATQYDRIYENGWVYFGGHIQHRKDFFGETMEIGYMYGREIPLRF